MQALKEIIVINYKKDSFIKYIDYLINQYMDEKVNNRYYTFIRNIGNLLKYYVNNIESIDYINNIKEQNFINENYTILINEKYKIYSKIIEMKDDELFKKYNIYILNLHNPEIDIKKSRHEYKTILNQVYIKDVKNKNDEYEYINLVGLNFNLTKEIYTNYEKFFVDMKELENKLTEFVIKIIKTIISNIYNIYMSKNIEQLTIQLIIELVKNINQNNNDKTNKNIPIEIEIKNIINETIDKKYRQIIFDNTYYEVLKTIKKIISITYKMITDNIIKPHMLYKMQIFKTNASIPIIKCITYLGDGKIMFSNDISKKCIECYRNCIKIVIKSSSSNIIFVYGYCFYHFCLAKNKCIINLPNKKETMKYISSKINKKNAKIITTTRENGITKLLCCGNNNKNIDDDDNNDDVNNDKMVNSKIINITPINLKNEELNDDEKNEYNKLFEKFNNFKITETQKKFIEIMMKVFLNNSNIKYTPIYKIIEFLNNAKDKYNYKLSKILSVIINYKKIQIDIICIYMYISDIFNLSTSLRIIGGNIIEDREIQKRELFEEETSIFSGSFLLPNKNLNNLKKNELISVIKEMKTFEIFNNIISNIDNNYHKNEIYKYIDESRIDKLNEGELKQYIIMWYTMFIISIIHVLY